MLQNVQLFIKLHGVRNIYILDHMLCGAMQDHICRQRLAKNQCELDECERPKHIEYLRLAKQTLMRELDNIEVKTFLYCENGVIEEICESEALVLVNKF